MKKLLPILPVLLILILPSCQKEGCTDRNAVNYDPDAKSDDGTCCFEQESDTSKSYEIQENDPNNPYFGTLVAAITVKRSEFTYSGNSCADLGYSGTRCENAITILSNVPDNISFSYTVEFGPGNAWVDSGTISLGPYGVERTIIDTSCEDYDIGTSTFDVGVITYN